MISAALLHSPTKMYSSTHNPLEQHTEINNAHAPPPACSEVASVLSCQHENNDFPVRPHIHSSQLDPKQEEIAVCLLIHPQAKLRATKAQTKKTKFTIRSKIIPICCICCKAGQRTAFFQCATRNVTGVYNGDHTYAQECCSKGQDGVLNTPLGISSSSSSSLSSSSSCLELFNIRSMPPLGLRMFCPSQCIPLWMQVGY